MKERPPSHPSLLLLDNLGFRYAGNLDQVYGEEGHVIFFDAVFVRGDRMVRKGNNEA
jgi:hypothetical protein